MDAEQIEVLGAEALGAELMGRIRRQHTWLQRWTRTVWRPMLPIIRDVTEHKSSVAQVLPVGSRLNTEGGTWS